MSWSTRSLLLHSAVVMGISSAALILYHALYFDGLRSSDGANYAGVARNVMQGQGLISSVIQPGLMTVVPTDRHGQVFVIQAPLWPAFLGTWFRLFGDSTLAVETLTGLLFVVAAVECWWLGYLYSGRVAAGYLACP